jgi:hypothetical protein
LIGGNQTDADFLTRARGQNEAIWNASVTAGSVLTYIDAGFNISSTVPVAPPPVVHRDARSTLNAMSFDAQQGGLKSDGYKGLGYTTAGAWAEYKNVQFGLGLTKFTAAVARLSGTGAQIQIRLDSPTGKLVGTLNVAPTGAWNNYESETATVAGATGIHNLYLVFTGTSAAVNLYNFAFA